MLRIVDTILQLIRDVAPIAATIERHDKDLAGQFRRALSSTAANTAEGSDQRGRRRGNHYAMALGSAREALVHLRAAEAWGIIPTIPAPITARFAHVIGTLHKVAHPTRHNP
jgi:four helix bundle protein